MFPFTPNEDVVWSRCGVEKLWFKNYPKILEKNEKKERKKNFEIYFKKSSFAFVLEIYLLFLLTIFSCNFESLGCIQMCRAWYDLV